MTRILPALLLLLAAAAPAPAQTAPERPPRVPMELRTGETPSTGPLGRTVAPPPAQDPAAVEEARRAAAELERAQRDRNFLKSQTAPHPARPDLGYDVTSGIQQRSLPGARPRPGSLATALTGDRAGCAPRHPPATRDGPS